MKNPEDIRILVVGDIMLDKYIIGEVSRISPEAPVPIVNVSEEYHTLGGCGNVVNNLRSLGAKVYCLASIGNDINGSLVIDELRQKGVGDLIMIGSNKTIVKERIVSNQRQVQMLRVDYESITPVDPVLSIKFLESIKDIDYNMIVVSDYAKGMITYELMQYLKGTGTAIIVDPKPINGYMYNGVYMITPNEPEWFTMKVSSAYNLVDVSFFLITKGKDGMTLIENGGDNHWDIGTEPVEIYNVSGAGDTVVAVMSLCISMGWKEVAAAYIANKCAAYVVTQPGTTTVTKEMFNQIVTDANTHMGVLK